MCSTEEGTNMQPTELTGYLRSDGRNYEAGIAGRIRFFQA